jgi:hypothetical protein
LQIAITVKHYFTYRREKNPAPMTQCGGSMTCYPDARQVLYPASEETPDAMMRARDRGQLANDRVPILKTKKKVL